jgi:hypothetical protein
MRTSGRVVALVGAAVLALTACGGRAAAPEKAYDAASPPQSPGHYRVVAVGDIACPAGEPTTATTCQQAATASLAQRLQPDLVLTLGDHQYPTGSLADLQAGYDTSWGALRSITRPAVGNHEYLTPGAAGYFSYFRGRTAPAPGWYRVTGGGWNIYVLNSSCDRVSCATEARWLRAQMAAHPSRCSLVTMHHPRYSSGSEHGSTRAVQGLWDAAYDHRNDLVLAGHDHDYERFKPMDAFGHLRPRRGMTSFVVGTGGRSLYGLGRRAPGSAYVENRAHGVLLLDLRPGAFAWSYRSTTGAQMDSGTRTCR